MPFVGRCPFCGQRSRIPEVSLGAAGQCPGCGSFYTLTPEEASEAGGDPGQAAPAPGMPPAPVPVVAPGNSKGKLVRALFDQAALEKPKAPWTEGKRVQPGRIESFGLGALLLGGAALLSASFPGLCQLVKPLGAVGLFLGLTGLLRSRITDHVRPLLPLTASLLAAAVLLTAWRWPGLLGPIYLAAQGRPALDAAALRIVPLPGNLNMEKSNPDWVDASQAALRQGQTLVRILRVWTGTAENSDKKDKGPGKEQHLFIKVQIFETRNPKKSGQVQPVLPGNQPKLTDDAGKTYPMRAGVPLPSEKTGKKSPVPALGRDKVFAFAPPQMGATYLRLELPGSAWGGSGAFRFTIPAAMIGQEGQRGKSGAETSQ